MDRPEPNLPRWDVSQIYASLESAEFQAELRAFLSEIGRLETLFDVHAVATGAGSVTSDAFGEVLTRLNATQERLQVPRITSTRSC